MILGRERKNGKRVEVFTTSTCTRCPLVKEYLDFCDVEYFEMIIDEDAEAETDAMMFGIYSVPCLKIGKKVLKEKEIFMNGQLQWKKIKDFLMSS